jgi:hypothetical protein
MPPIPAPEGPVPALLSSLIDVPPGGLPVFLPLMPCASAFASGSPWCRPQHLTPSAWRLLTAAAPREPRAAAITRADPANLKIMRKPSGNQ